MGIGLDLGAQQVANAIEHAIQNKDIDLVQQKLLRAILAHDANKTRAALDDGASPYAQLLVSLEASTSAKSFICISSTIELAVYIDHMLRNQAVSASNANASNTISELIKDMPPDCLVHELLFACELPNKNAAGILLEHGVDPTYKNSINVTYAYKTAHEAHYNRKDANEYRDILLMLANRGADFTVTPMNNHLTALDYVKRLEWNDVLSAIEAHECRKQIKNQHENDPAIGL